jgi:ubiquinone/menaquinone biosynthesis C-methylase UbiE
VRASTDYQVVTSTDLTHATDSGAWRRVDVVHRQDEAWQTLVRDMLAGRPRRDLVAAADAVRATGMSQPSVLEVGCGSGYYCRILPHLLGRPIGYTGLDYSPAMVDLARQRYPRSRFCVGDATSLPFGNASFDVVFNAAALMHIPNYRAAVAEARRVGRRWCIFHTLVLLRRRETTFVTKRAYGQRTVEIIFNEAQLRQLLTEHGLTVRQELPSVPDNLQPLLGEPTRCVTWLCEITPDTGR